MLYTNNLWNHKTSIKTNFNPNMPPKHVCATRQPPASAHQAATLLNRPVPFSFPRRPLTLTTFARPLHFLTSFPSISVISFDTHIFSFDHLYFMVYKSWISSTEHPGRPPLPHKLRDQWRALVFLITEPHLPTAKLRWQIQNFKRSSFFSQPCIAGPLTCATLPPCTVSRGLGDNYSIGKEGLKCISTVQYSVFRTRSPADWHTVL